MLSPKTVSTNAKIFSAATTMNLTAPSTSIGGTKQLMLNIDDLYLLKQFWGKANVILSIGSVVSLPKGNYCITDEEFGYNICQDKKNWFCNCRDFIQTGGICPHILVFHNEVGDLIAFLEKYSKKKGILSHIIDGNAPSRGGENLTKRKSDGV